MVNPDSRGVGDGVDDGGSHSHRRTLGRTFGSETSRGVHHLHHQRDDFWGFARAPNAVLLEAYRLGK